MGLSRRNNDLKRFHPYVERCIYQGYPYFFIRKGITSVERIGTEEFGADWKRYE